MAREDWRSYYAIGWDKPEVCFLFKNKASAQTAFDFFKQVGDTGLRGPKPVCILRVKGRTADIQRQLWSYAA
jgi:hypothetical protein